MKKKKILRLITLCFAAAAPVWFGAGFDNRLRVQHYTVSSPKIDDPLRIVLLTDLHSCVYGQDERELIDAVRAERPDIVLLGGDIYDDIQPDKNADALLAALGAEYPCYYITGNHEFIQWEDVLGRRSGYLEAHHVTWLANSVQHLLINGVRLTLCGINDPAAWIVSGYTDAGSPGYAETVGKLAEECEEDEFSILLAHRPERFDLYSGYPFDLVCAGHAHGGQIRIPGLLNGLFSPNQGLFPKYTGDVYEMNGTRMAVSRGLARESTVLPRFWNRPEVTVIDLAPETAQ